MHPHDQGKVLTYGLFLSWGSFFFFYGIDSLENGINNFMLVHIAIFILAIFFTILMIWALYKDHKLNKVERHEKNNS